MEGGPPMDEQLAAAVGEKFLVGYYKVASEDTVNLHKFYRKNAFCSFGDAAVAAGWTQIQEKLAVLSGAHFDLETGGVTVAFQPTTTDGGVLIMVSGLVSLRNKSGGYDPARRFVQTFYLTPKEPNTGRTQQLAFSITNDLHRFVDTGSDATSRVSAASSASASPATASVNGQATAAKAEAPKPQAPVTESKSSPPAAAPPSPEKAKPATDASANKGERGPRGSKAPTQPPVAPAVAEKKEAPAKPSGPPSYSQVAKSSPPTKMATSNGVNKESSQPQQTEKPKEASQPSRPASPPASSSVYVKNGQSIPQAVLQEAIAAVFGPVLSVSTKGAAVVVQLRGPKEAELAIAAKEMVVEGVTISLEVYRGSSSRGGQRRGGGGGERPTGGDGARRASGGAAGEQKQPRSDKPKSAPRQSSTGSGGGSSRPRGGGSGQKAASGAPQ